MSSGSWCFHNIIILLNINEEPRELEKNVKRTDVLCTHGMVKAHTLPVEPVTRPNVNASYIICYLHWSTLRLHLKQFLQSDGPPLAEPWFSSVCWVQVHWPPIWVNKPQLVESKQALTQQRMHDRYRARHDSIKIVSHLERFYLVLRVPGKEIDILAKRLHRGLIFYLQWRRNNRHRVNAAWHD